MKARLPAPAKKLLLSWIEQGCPKGDARDLPPARVFNDGWGLGKPDVVLTMPEKFTVPAEAPKGGIEYQHFVIPTNLDGDVWDLPKADASEPRAFRICPLRNQRYHTRHIWVGEDDGRSGRQDL